MKEPFIEHQWPAIVHSVPKSMMEHNLREEIGVDSRDWTYEFIKDTIARVRRLQADVRPDEMLTLAVIRNPEHGCISFPNKLTRTAPWKRDQLQGIAEVRSLANFIGDHSNGGRFSVFLTRNFSEEFKSIWAQVKSLPIKEAMGAFCDTMVKAGENRFDVMAVFDETFGEDDAPSLELAYIWFDQTRALLGSQK